MLFSFSLQYSIRVAALTSGGSILHLSNIFRGLHILFIWDSLIFSDYLCFRSGVCLAHLSVYILARCPTNWDFMMVATFIITLTRLLLRVYSFWIFSFFVIFGIDNSNILLATEIVFAWCSSRLFLLRTSWLRVRPCALP